jgi:hypothetical protein
LPGLIGRMGPGGRFVGLAAEPTRFSAIGTGRCFQRMGTNNSFTAESTQTFGFSCTVRFILKGAA